MSQFRKKPVIVEAWPFDGGWETAQPIVHAGAIQQITFYPGRHTLRIKTLEGDMTASAGDWIIRGVAGEFYPCKPDIFEATYEAFPAEDAP